MTNAEAQIAVELARRNEAHIARIEGRVAEDTAAAARIDELAAGETDTIVVAALKQAVATLRSEARSNEKWLEDLRRNRAGT